jgi:hypothetical protein
LVDCVTSVIKFKQPDRPKPSFQLMDIDPTQVGASAMMPKKRSRAAAIFDAPMTVAVALACASPRSCVCVAVKVTRAATFDTVGPTS